MIIQIDPHNGIPIFRQIQDQIKLAILCGVWKPGDEIPSTRKLSETLKVNPMTISKAFSLLEADDWLERRRGLPTIVNASLSPGQLEKTKAEILLELLTPIGIRVRQLSIDPETASTVWQQILSENTQS